MAWRDTLLDGMRTRTLRPSMVATGAASMVRPMDAAIQHGSFNGCRRAWFVRWIPPPASYEPHFSKQRNFVHDKTYGERAIPPRGCLVAGARRASKRGRLAVNRNRPPISARAQQVGTEGDTQERQQRSHRRPRPRNKCGKALCGEISCLPPPNERRRPYAAVGLVRTEKTTV